MKKISSVVLIIIFFTALTSCKKKKTNDTPAIETGTVTDIDNNTYKTVKIGSQWWMAENLKTKTYRNGMPITKSAITDADTVWMKTQKGMCCSYFNDDSNIPQYGLLYNWYAIADTSGIAPAGWHVPSDEEWKQLEEYLGMSAGDADAVNWRGADIAGKMKVKSPLGWTQYGTIWSGNESGFAAIGSCCRLFSGQWGDPGLQSTGFWWSSAEHPADKEAWYRYLDYKKTNVFRYHGSKNYGMSIRCVKD